MNVIDIALALVMSLAIWAGWKKGFILGTINLVVWIGSLLTGFFGYKYVGALLQKLIPSLGVWNLPLAFIITIIVARLILALIFNSLLKVTPQYAHESGTNKAFGIIPGFVNGLIYDTILAALLLSLPIADSITSTTRDSKIATNLVKNVEWLDDKLSPIFDQAVRRSLNQLTVEPDSNETVPLHFTVTDAKARPDLEAKMLDLVNQERTKRGLKPLVADPELTEVGREHSQDMFARGYFSHYTPEGKDPFDRMRAAGIKFLAAGENLALGQTLSICHEGLMNSPGHRANILNPSYGRLGIGILDGGIHGLMISQEFRN
jgi:uncharacterized protein YkwD